MVNPMNHTVATAIFLTAFILGKTSNTIVRAEAWPVEQ